MHSTPARWRIGIIHAYPSAHLIETLQAAGFAPVVIGPANAPLRGHLPDTDLIDVALGDSDALLQVVAAHHRMRPLHGIIPVYEGASVLTVLLAQQLGLWSLPMVAAIASRNKYLSSQIWQASRIAVPRTVPLVDLAQGYRAIESTIGYPAVLKLADSMNSQGVIKVNDRAGYEAAISVLGQMLEQTVTCDLQTDRNRWVYGQSDVKVIAQSFCPGAEVGVDVILHQNQAAVLGMFEKAPAPGPCFAESMSVWPTSLGEQAEQELGQIAINALRALGVTQGIGHVEIRYADDGARVLEAGVRPGGGYTVRAVEQLTGINPYVLLARMAVGESITLPQRREGAMLYGGIVYPRSGQLRHSHGLEVFAELPGLLDLVILNQPGDKVFALPESAQPHFCYYLLKGGKREEVLARHRQIQASVALDIV